MTISTGWVVHIPPSPEHRPAAPRGGARRLAELLRSRAADRMQWASRRCQVTAGDKGRLKRKSPRLPSRPASQKLVDTTTNSAQRNGSAAPSLTVPNMTPTTII